MNLTKLKSLKETLLSESSTIDVSSIMKGNLKTTNIEKNTIRDAEFKSNAFQAVLNAIYSEYNDYDIAFNALKNSDPVYAVILVLGAMNYQVENGGFQQWYDNGYMSIQKNRHGKSYFEGYDNLDIKDWLVKQLKNNNDLKSLTSTSEFKKLISILSDIELENPPEEDDGSGTAKYLTCPKCDGEGTVIDIDSDTGEEEEIDCPECDGDGKYENDNYRPVILSLPYGDKTNNRYYEINSSILKQVSEFLKSYIYLKLKRMNSPLADEIN